MSLIDNMTNVYNRVYGISDRLGVKTHIDFSYSNRNTGSTTVVLPRPRISSPPAHKLVEWQQKDVEVNNTDKYVTGISRTYVDITIGHICTINEQEHTILWIDRDKSVTYNVLVRPERQR